MPSGEPASTQQFDASAAGFSASAPIASSTTRTVDGGGVVYRVDSGFDLDQYLYRRDSPLDFYIDVTDDFGPVNEDGRPLPGNALYGEEALITVRAIAPRLTKNGSISANAEILAAEIDTLLTGLPVQEVDIVGHSMGGLDGRLYAFDNPGRVRKLLMMGTPNGGSELSNVLCGIKNLPWWAWVTSPGGALTAEGIKNLEEVKAFGDCDGPHNGLYQLQTPYVRNVFNVRVPDMPTVEYATIAGRGGGAGSPVLDGFMPGIAGDDDGTVSVASVRWLSQFGGEQRGLHSTLYPSIDEDHMALYRDSESLARPLALCWMTKSYSECMDAGEPAGSARVSTLSAFSEAEVGTAASAVEPTLEFQQAVGPADIVPAGASRDYVVEVAEGEFAHLVVLGGEDLEILLDGAPLTPTAVFAVEALEADLASTATLTVRNTGAEERPFLGLLFVASARALTIDVPTLVHPGEDVTVVATLTGGRAEDQPVALVTRGDEPVLEIPLASVGADRWEVSFPAPPAGSYSVSAVVTGVGPRLVSAPMIVSDGGALAGSFTEVTVDQDRDGLIDALEVTVPVEVLQAGEYRLAGALVTADGRRIAAAGTTGALAAGPGSLTLRFDGREIHDAALAGPWQLVDVALSDGALNLLDVGDLGPVSHSDYRGYERDAIALDGFADEGVDADGDGLFEVLRISTEATVDTSGYYAVNAKLVTMDGVDVGRAQRTVYLQAGTTTVDLVFDGATIGATGLDGPYVLRDFAVYPTARPSAGVALVNAHVTAPYRSEQFPGGVARDLVPRADFHQAVEGAVVDLDATPSVDDRGIVGYLWDFGDGTGAEGVQVTHEYSRPGDHTVTLTVTDTAGQAASVAQVVRIEPFTCQGRVPTIIGGGSGLIQGTAGNDVIFGTSADEWILGGAGDDTICAGRGNDTIDGGSGQDQLWGQGGHDLIFGGTGVDTADGGAGDDVISGGNGRDALTGGDGMDVVYGENGDDDLFGGDGDDHLFGGHGADNLYGEDGDDHLDGGPGQDVTDGGSGDDQVVQ